MSFRLQTGGGAAAGSSFGLSPRLSAAVRPLSSQSHPRADPSPKMPASFHNSATHTAHAFPTPASAAAQFAAAATSVGGVSMHTFDSQPKRRHDLPSDAGRTRRSKVSTSSDDDEEGSSGYSSQAGARSAAPHQRDRESAELALWKQQQRLLEVQTRNFNLIKYGMLATLALVLLIVVFLVGQQSAGSHTAALRPAPSQLYQSNSPGGGVGAPSSTPPSLDSLDGVADDLEAARRTLTEMTQREMERERQELFQIDPSAQSRYVDPADAEIAKLDPVTRATVVVPQPGDHVDAQDGERGHAYAKNHARSSIRAGRLDDLETPELLRRLAETQRMAQLEREKDASDAMGTRRNARVAQAGSSSEEEGLDALLKVPAHPTPSQVSHVVIEKLIHENTPEGATAKPHSHKDHPSVPLFGQGMPAILMPVDPKAPKPKVAPVVPAPAPAPTPAPAPAAATVPVAAPVEAAPTPVAPAPATATPVVPAAPAAAETKADASSTRKADADATESVDLDAPVAVPSSSDEDEDLMLSELSQASRPTEVSAVAHEAATKLNKVTGLKGPVLRGANADSQHADKSEDAEEEEEEGEKEKEKEKDDEDAPKPKSKSKTKALKNGKTATGVKDAAFRKAAAKEWMSHKGQTLADTVHWSMPAAGAKEAKYLFDEEVELVVLTSRANRALARKIQALFSPLVKRLTFVSDKRDKALNATVLTNPRPDWKVAKDKSTEAPWRLYQLFKRLASPRRNPNPAKFYFVLHDTTFPLLDQIAWKLKQFRAAYKGAYPNFVGGRKSGVKFEQTFWKEQQAQGEEVFGEKRLFVVPSYMVGFDHEFVKVVSEPASPDSCPVLPTESLALSGLVECAGGAMDLTEFDFLAQARSNHREKKIDIVASPLSQWRNFDAFNGCNTPGMLQEAFDAYYGKLKE